MFRNAPTREVISRQAVPDMLPGGPLPFLTALVSIFAIFGLGYLLGRVRKTDSKAMTDMAIYLFTPCLIFDKVATSSMPAVQTGKILLFSFILTALVYLVSIATAKALRFERLDRYALLLGTVSMNAIFLGLPFIEITLGAEALAYAVVFVMGMNIVQATFLVYFAAAGRLSAWKAFVSVFRIPMIYAFIGGFVVSKLGLDMPLAVMLPISMLGRAAIPVALVILGVQLTRVHIGGAWKNLTAITVIRLVASPAIAYGLCRLMGLNDLVLVVMVLESAMPSAVNAGLLAAEFNTKPEFVAGAILVTTLLSAVTLSGIFVLLR